ncbi:MAG TPA: hypothetical protein VMF53_06860 [Alphaproteobacteria bacterium]|nr:hypothetical protein [Alphaproteobacteria bacterium]
MTDIVNGSSKEAVAYALMLGIAHHAKKTDLVGGFPVVNADEQWVLGTFQKCLAVVSGYELSSNN